MQGFHARQPRASNCGSRLRLGGVGLGTPGWPLLKLDHLETFPLELRLGDVTPLRASRGDQRLSRII